MTTDTFVLVVLTNLATLALSTAFYVSRISELRVAHVQRVAEINHDYAMQRRTYGGVPMESLIGLETFDPQAGE